MHKTIANLSSCEPNEISAIKWALRHKNDFPRIQELVEKNTTAGQTDKTLLGKQDIVQGFSCGAVIVVMEMAKRLGITKALGSDRQGMLALWQVVARVINQGSRLSTVRFASSHGACDLLRTDAFNEDHLYRNLPWLASHQAQIEDVLYKQRIREGGDSTVFLYDITSSYLRRCEKRFFIIWL